MKTQLITTTTKITRRYRFLLCTLLIATPIFYSCDSFTETDMPVTEMNESAVFEDPATATAAMTNVYAQMRDGGILTGKASGASKVMGLYSDELSYWGQSTDDSEKFYKNTVAASTALIRDWWNTTYSQIYATNSILEGLQSSNALEDDFKKQLTGEAKLVRGLLHFYLVQLYGDIPYITTTDYTLNIKVSRMPQNQVMQKIIDDLEEATTLLSENDPSEARVRPTVFAAKAILARVYLYNGNWGEAANSASAVLNASAYFVWDQELAATFLKESTTTIWQFSPRTATRNTDEASTFIFNAGPPPQVALNENLLAAFEPGDLRKTRWTKAITDGTTTWYHANKYKKAGNSAPQQEYAILLRTAEQYLIRAEARAQQGELIGAIEDLNKVRSKAGLPDTPATTKGALIAAIVKERRVELFTEYGHRFFDLKRTGGLDAVLSNTKASWNTNDQLLPLPLEELRLNGHLQPQNPGY
jgi:hypothetical protein